MSIIEDILRSKLKPKEKEAALVRLIKKGESFLEELMIFMETARDADVGLCMAAIAEAAKDEPRLVARHLGWLIKHINHRSSKVRWETSEIIAEAAPKYPHETWEAVPKLKANIKDGGTVVRWSAAAALTAIAAAHPPYRSKLIPFFEKMIQEEENNGVRNVYVKALKALADK